MKFIPYTRSINITTQINEVSNFVIEIKNLPKWTNFFVEVGEADLDGVKVNTVIGPAITRIESDNIEGSERIIIYSHFKEREERAEILLSEDQGTKVNFTLRLPSEWPQEKIDMALSNLERELVTLKELLENNEKKK